MNNMFEQEGNTIALLQEPDTLANEIQGLFGAGQRKHGADTLTSHDATGQVLAVPFQVEAREEFIKQKQITFVPLIERSDRKSRAVRNEIDAGEHSRIFIEHFGTQSCTFGLKASNGFR